MEVWLLWHTHTVGEEDDEKLIGVYSTQQNAEQAQSRAAGLPGFRELPEGFGIDSYIVDQDRWTKGFVRLAPEGPGP
jgi:homoserine kinase type II